MRNRFIANLVQHANINSNVVLLVGDLGFSVVEEFADKFPERFFNVGVAEQNMAGIAAGMASEGYHVFIYSIANFPTFRCAEQIRNDIDYHNLPVTIVSIGGGLAYGSLGYSHHAVQDYSLMRSMPNMLIASPGDPEEVSACLNYLINNPQPSYLRLAKSGEPLIHQKTPKVKPGTWLKVYQSEKAKNAILTTGNTLKMTMDYIKKNPEQNYDIFTLPLWGMKLKEYQYQYIEKYESVTTVENHLLDGGFGSWILESLPTHLKLRDKIIIKALNYFICGKVGSEEVLHELGGLKL